MFDLLLGMRSPSLSLSPSFFLPRWNVFFSLSFFHSLLYCFESPSYSDKLTITKRKKERRPGCLNCSNVPGRTTATQGKNHSSIPRRRYCQKTLSLLSLILPEPNTKMTAWWQQETSLHYATFPSMLNRMVSWVDAHKPLSFSLQQQTDSDIVRKMAGGHMQESWSAKAPEGGGQLT